MKTNILQSNFSFRLLFFILISMLLSQMSGWFIPAAHSADMPFDTSEVQKLRAFLGTQSMKSGKTNADLLGVDINNPGSWGKWSESKGAKHFIDIQWKSNYLAGSLEISEFSSLGYFVLDCFDDITNKFDNITIRNNPGLGWGVILNSVNVKELRIEGNKDLHHLELRGKVDVLTLDQPDLGYLEIGTLGNVPVDLTKCTKLQTLKLYGVKNIPTWNIANFPNLREVFLDGLRNITSLHPINCPELESISIYNMPDLKSIQFGDVPKFGGLSIEKTAVTSLDFRMVPNLVALICSGNNSLTNLIIPGSSKIMRISVEGNSLLRTLNLSNMPNLELLKCSHNESLEVLTLKGLPKVDRLDCSANALLSLDVSGLTALKELSAFDNQMTKFITNGINFHRLNLLWGNRLNNVSTIIGGHNINLKAFGEGGCIRFDGGPSFWLPYGFEMEGEGLPEPYNTILEKVEGTGFPPKENDYKGGFLLDKDINATFYFKADIYFVNYFGDLEGDLPDEDEGEWDSEANLDYQSIVGNPFKLPGEYPLPSKTGFEIYGWYTDSTLTHEWNFEKDTLRGLLILYPKWLPKGMPVVMSVKRQMPAAENTSANKVVYLITFSKTVSGVDVSDFKLTTEGPVTGKIASISAANGHTLSVEVNTITGTGTLRLDVKNTGTGITDADKNPLAGGYSSGEIYRIYPATGISNPIIFNDDCKIFPNPTTGKVQINTPNNEPVRQVDVFGMQGQKIAVIDGSEDSTFDLSGLTPAVYLLKLSKTDKLYIRKVIKR